MKIAKRAYSWAASKADLPLAPLWLGFIFLGELFLFLPFDAVLMLFCLQNPERRFAYAAIATLSSLVVASIGYAIGYLLWDTIGPFVVKHLISADFFHRFVEHYRQHENAAVFIGGLLPIPFKAVTLSAGFCQLSIGTYLFYIALSRAVRFFFLAELMYRWKTQIKGWLDRHFNRVLIAIGVKVLFSFCFFWILGH
ncbi:MAG TPA: VTT domain-containing protein [Rhabdochlamydiaceae bacterium]|jgi:membrane protein YqaA with SNARE-associated domain